MAQRSPRALNDDSPEWKATTERVLLSKRGQKRKEWRQVRKEAKPLCYWGPGMVNLPESATVSSTFIQSLQCQWQVNIQFHSKHDGSFCHLSATSWFKLECEMGTWFSQVHFVKDVEQFHVLES